MSQRRNNYRLLQIACIVSAVLHTLTIFLFIWAYRSGHLDQFSIQRLMQFPPQHPIIWKSVCLLVSLSTLSFLFLILSLRQIVNTPFKMLITAALCLTIIGVTIDLQSQASMLVMFSDISSQWLYGNSTHPKSALLLLAWQTVNHSITASLFQANLLYSLSGILVALAILTGKGLPHWIGWAALPVWLLACMASLLTFCANLPSALLFLFLSVISFIVWTIIIAATVDGLSHRQEDNSTIQSGNQTKRQN